MLGSKSIIRHKCPRARPHGDVPDKVAICLGASRVELPPVQMQNRLDRLDAG
jgi:hypothetical protein